MEGVLGQEHAATLLRGEQVATKADLQNEGQLLRGDLAILRRDLENQGQLVRGDVEVLRGEMENQGQGLRREIADVEERLTERFDLKMEGLEHRLAATFRKELIAQTRAFMFVTIAAMGVIGSLVAIE